MVDILTAEKIKEYEMHLREEEKSEATIEKYIHAVNEFCRWLDGRHIAKNLVIEWKQQNYKNGKTATTVNAMLAALHSYFAFIGCNEYRVKYFKVQRKLFCDESKDLKKDEFHRLVSAARICGKERIALVMETIGATGIRVSELRYITVDAVNMGKAEIALKGKIRIILLPNKLTKKLKKYIKKQKIASGEIFLTKSGKPLSRRQIWGEMKCLGIEAGVDCKKVFPHNLRHLFAKAFFKVCNNIVYLADVLGHSSIETTRIYLITSGVEHSKTIELLNFVV